LPGGDLVIYDLFLRVSALQIRYGYVHRYQKNLRN